ncbi:MAG: cobyrinate a,c-diamide synthase [Chloroflexi bacterium]|nr:cobyrinate a,c-diamide synthase [Chloroflexota bacterium]MYE40571.1 cobyrinate a,c-diamide synthase [Chloroflexota bacterium]
MTPTVVVAGVRSGVGKTTIATGIMGALTRRGFAVQPFKAGPDYIDPSYHQVACGVPSRNLDTWLLPHPTVLELYAKASARRQISVVEGVMGLFDGHSSLDEEGSTAQLAKLIGAPVILVADASKVARSVAAEVLGYQRFDPALNVAGVILNGVASDRHLEFCKPQIEATTGLPVLGYLPRRPEFEQPERHLGLIPTVEGTVARQWYDALIAQIEETIDVGRIAELAGMVAPPAPSAHPELVEGRHPQVYPSEPQPKRAVIAVAQDKAFNFYYQDSLDLLEAWGAEIVPFSPLEDASLPEGAGGVYLGGGFPEMFAAELSANRPMLDSIRQAAERDVPIYGECGGLMYLGRSLTGFDEVAYPMAGLIPAVSAMSQSRLSLGYREVEARADGPLLPAGQQVRGHEFHWSTLEQPPQDGESVYRVVNQGGRPDGFRAGSVWGTYVHVHLGSAPGLALRFVETCAARSSI